MKFVDAIAEKTLRTTVTMTAARGRGKSATLGLAIAVAVAMGSAARSPLSHYRTVTYNVDILWLNAYRWRGSATGRALDFAISRLRVQILLEAMLRNNLGQVVHTYVSLSPSSITWYRPNGGDALRLGR